KFPYITIPVGFGLIFQGIIQEEMTKNGIEITLGEVTKSMIFPGIAMIIGLLIALLITYRKDREPKDSIEQGANQEVGMAEGRTGAQSVKWMIAHTFTVIAILVALTIQLITESLILGALGGIFVMFLLRVIKLYEGERVVHEGIGMMGMIAFVMLIASGYAHVLT